MAVTAFASGTKTPPIGTFTVTIATPGVVSFTSHGLAVGDKVLFTTTGALPTGLAVNTWYYVITAGFGSNAFQVSATDGGSAINTTGSQSGTHSMIAEVFLSSPNAAGTYQLIVDAINMTVTEVTDLKAYQMVLTGGTSRPITIERLQGVPSTESVISTSLPVSNELTDTNSVRFSLIQRTGTARAYPWKVLKFA